MVEWMSGYPAKTTALLTKMNLLREDKADVVAGRSQSGVQTRRNRHLDHRTPARSSLARFPDPLQKLVGEVIIVIAFIDQNKGQGIENG